MRYLSEGMRFASLVDHRKSAAFPDAHLVRFEVPAGIRSAGGCFGKKVVQCSGGTKSNVVTEVSPEHSVEGSRIAFVQGYDLCGGGGRIFLRNCLHRSRQHQ